MNKKQTIFLSLFLILLSIVSVGSFVYSRTKTIEDCAKILEKYAANHACILTPDGSMVFELYPDAAPKSVEKITKLANENKFYDDLEIYRAVADFVIQGGIQDIQSVNSNISNLNSDLQEKIKLTEDKIETEANFDKLGLTEEEKTALLEAGYASNSQLNSRQFEYGSLAFANAGPNTNSTEFFVVSSKDAANNESIKALKGKYTNMGKLVSGSELLDKISSAEVINEDLIDKVKIIEFRVKK